MAENVSITASVIGQRCTIGAGSKISDSYIFEGAVIGEHCIIERSIIGAGVQVKDGSRVPKGCLLADGVIIGPDASLQPFERLSVSRDEVDVETDHEDEDSDIEEVEASKFLLLPVLNEGLLTRIIYSTDQDSIDKVALGKDTNAVMWPRGPPDEDEDEEDEGPENYKNQRFMKLGMNGLFFSLQDDEAQSFFLLGDNASDLDVEEADSSSSDSESSSEDELEFHERESLSGLSDGSAALEAPGLLMADAEFRTEVQQSLERAFAEGHSVENASVELKTLRMASNVPLRRVKEAVVAAIVEKINVVDGDAGLQRKEIGAVIGRWGNLIDRIGGVDPVETVSILQVMT